MNFFPMKNKELQLQLIDKLDHVVADVEEMVTATETVTHAEVDRLKSDLHNLLHTVLEIEKAELETPENSVRKMKDSVEELKRKLSGIHTPEETARETEDSLLEVPPRNPQTQAVSGNEMENESQTENGLAEEMRQETETTAVFIETETESETGRETMNRDHEDFEPQAVPEPDLSDFIARPDEVPTSYVTSLTAMAQAQAGEQDMSQVAVYSTAMPDEKVVRQVEQRSDIFTKLKETERQTFANGQNNLKSLVERLKSNKTVNDVHQPTVSNLRSCIGINEKFLFINELFKGNIKEYGDMLQALDKAEDGVEMNRILLPLHERYTWNEQSLAYITLSDILKKKFGCAPQPLQD